MTVNVPSHFSISTGRGGGGDLTSDGKDDEEDEERRRVGAQEQPAVHLPDNVSASAL